MNSKKPRILIVEDEEAIRTGLKDLLIYHGYEVDEAADGKTGLDKSLTGLYDLILLDVMLPKMDGYEICQRIRDQDREQAIIMLTAKSSDEDVIQGLKLGADDYVAKPFSVAQLVLRIKAVLRRSGVDDELREHITLTSRGGHFVELDVKNLSANLSWVLSETSVPFTRREMEVLQYLYLNHERPVPREELLTKVWGYARDLDLETRTVDIHIAKIRRKIEQDSSSPVFLLTVRGAGYKLMVGSDV